MDFTTKTKGRWYDILAQVGIPSNFLKNVHGPCPLCGGKDRYRWDNKDGSGSYFCSQCGAGNGAQLAMKYNNWDFKTMATEVNKILGYCRIKKGIRKMDDKAKHDMLVSLWNGGVPVSLNNASGKYLKNRCGITEFSHDIRHVNKCAYTKSDGTNFIMPALIAKIRNKENHTINIQRIYLTNDGRKADLKPAKKNMPGSMPPGCAVRLMEHKEVLGIAEGIETAYCASQLFKVPVWATLSAQNLERFRAPNGVKKLMLFGDNDESLTGHAAVYACAHIHRVNNIETEQYFPDEVGNDWADEWGYINA